MTYLTKNGKFYIQTCGATSSLPFYSWCCVKRDSEVNTFRCVNCLFHKRISYPSPFEEGFERGAMKSGTFLLLEEEEKI